jgi:hypothetical protein
MQQPPTSFRGGGLPHLLNAQILNAQKSGLHSWPMDRRFRDIPEAADQDINSQDISSGD